MLTFESTYFVSFEVMFANGVKSMGRNTIIFQGLRISSSKHILDIEALIKALYPNVSNAVLLNYQRLSWRIKWI